MSILEDDFDAPHNLAYHDRSGYEWNARPLPTMTYDEQPIIEPILWEYTQPGREMITTLLALPIKNVAEIIYRFAGPEAQEGILRHPILAQRLVDYFDDLDARGVRHQYP